MMAAAMSCDRAAAVRRRRAAVAAAHTVQAVASEAHLAGDGHGANGCRGRSRGGRRGRGLHHLRPLQPRVPEEGLEAGPPIGHDLEAFSNKVLAFWGQPRPESEVGSADLLVGLEGDVPADHVVQQDSQAPDGGLFAVVVAMSDPFGGRVDPGA